MRREVRAVLHVLLGAAVLHISLFSELYLRYVRRGLRPYLIASGMLLIAVGLAGAAAAARDLLRHRPDPHDHDRDHDHDHGHGHDHGRARTAWLLLLPVLAIYLLAPDALGAYTARRSDSTTVRPAGAGFPPLPAGDPVQLRLADFDARAVWDTGGSLKDRPVRLTGFATPKPGGGWYLTRLTITCCAADALTSKVEIQGLAGPPEGGWAEVTGSWRPDGRTGQDTAVPVLTATKITRIQEPGDPYE